MCIYIYEAAVARHMPLNLRDFFRIGSGLVVGFSMLKAVNTRDSRNLETPTSEYYRGPK